MNLISIFGISGAIILAFANGANDISKSVATLVGSGESDYKKAVLLVSLAAAAGATIASGWAVKMTLLFTKGMLSPQVAVNQLFALAVLGGAIGWVLFASKTGLPVSTTHSIVGSVVLTGLYAFGFDNVLWAGVTKKIVLPLLISPIAAFGLGVVIFRFLYWLCERQYCINCHWAHWMSAISSGFARGLNDTPKIAALGMVFYHVIDPNVHIAPKWFFLILALANAAGSVIMGLKVTETLAHQVTRMNHLEGFAANLATSAMVMATAVKGFPVSTTHVSGSAIMGMGLQKGGLNWKTAGGIVAAWLVTVPIAGAIGVGCYWLLNKIV